MGFETTVSIRYSDLDRFHHVTSSRYLELVEAAIFRPGDQNRTVRETVTPLYQKQVHIEFRRGIPLVHEVRARVEPELTPETAHLKFQILGVGNDTVHANGVIEYSAVDKFAPMPSMDAPVAFAEKGMPRVFRWDLLSRFDDVNARGEVSLSRHVDYVVASRGQYLTHTDGVGLEDLLKKGWAFFLTESLVTSHKPISGVLHLEPASWLHRIERNGAEFTFVFQMCSKDGKQIFSNGKLTYAVMNISSGIPKRTPFPADLEKIFFSK